jgi:hypothetical protein
LKVIAFGIEVKAGDVNALESDRFAFEGFQMIAYNL